MARFKKETLKHLLTECDDPNHTLAIGHELGKLEIMVARPSAYEVVQRDIAGVTRTCHNAGAICKVIIEDTGPGIPDEQKRSIFERAGWDVRAVDRVAIKYDKDGVQHYDVAEPHWNADDRSYLLLHRESHGERRQQRNDEPAVLVGNNEEDQHRRKGAGKQKPCGLPRSPGHDGECDA